MYVKNNSVLRSAVVTKFQRKIKNFKKSKKKHMHTLLIVHTLRAAVDHLSI